MKHSKYCGKLIDFFINEMKLSMVTKRSFQECCLLRVNKYEVIKNIFYYTENCVGYRKKTFKQDLPNWKKKSPNVLRAISLNVYGCNILIQTHIQQCQSDITRYRNTSVVLYLKFKRKSILLKQNSRCVHVSWKQEITKHLQSYQNLKKSITWV